MRIKMFHRITLKDTPIDAIMATFEEGTPSIEALYSTHAKTLDRLINRGNGLDYLTILYRTLTSNQQQQMYLRILKKFAKDEKKYIENPIVSYLLFVFILFRNY